jgi:drug/metabolite transporter (DMT)-like permease
MVAPRGMNPPSKKLRNKTYTCIVLMVLFGPLGNALLGKGMKSVGTLRVHGVGQAVDTFLRIFSTGSIWLGIAFLIGFFVAYSLVLTWADYSYVQPASAGAYAVVALWGHFLLHESVTPMRWAGVAVICLGVLFVGNTHPRTTDHHFRNETK